MRRSLSYLYEEANGGFYYLATPYSHPEATIREARTYTANKISGLLMAQGLYIYSPIWNCHQCAVDNALPTDFMWWLRFNESFIKPSAGIIVAQMGGWKDSRGVTHEIVYAREINKTVFFLDPDDLRVDDEYPIVQS